MLCGGTGAPKHEPPPRVPRRRRPFRGTQVRTEVFFPCRLRTVSDRHERVAAVTND